MPTEKATPPNRYLPALFDMDRLFAASRLGNWGPKPGEIPGEKPAKESPAPPRILEQAGFVQGSKILIAGEAGSGKTTLVLAMARALMVQWSRHFSAVLPDEGRAAHLFGPTSADKAKARGKKDHKEEDSHQFAPVEHEMCFISTEVDLARLQHLFGQYGWFTKEDHVFPTERQSWGEGDGPSIVIPKITETKVRLPLHGSGEVVDLVLNKVKDAYGGRERSARFSWWWTASRRF